MSSLSINYPLPSSTFSRRDKCGVSALEDLLSSPKLGKKECLEICLEQSLTARDESVYAEQPILKMILTIYKSHFRANPSMMNLLNSLDSTLERSKNRVTIECFGHITRAIALRFLGERAKAIEECEVALEKSLGKSLENPLEKPRCSDDEIASIAIRLCFEMDRDIILESANLWRSRIASYPFAQERSMDDLHVFIVMEELKSPRQKASESLDLCLRSLEVDHKHFNDEQKEKLYLQIIQTIMDFVRNNPNSKAQVFPLKRILDSRPQLQDLPGIQFQLKGWIQSLKGEKKHALECFEESLEFPGCSDELIYEGALQRYKFSTEIFGFKLSAASSLGFITRGFLRDKKIGAEFSLLLAKEFLRQAFNTENSQDYKEYFQQAQKCLGYVYITPSTDEALATRVANCHQEIRDELDRKAETLKFLIDGRNRLEKARLEGNGKLTLKDIKAAAEAIALAIKPNHHDRDLIVECEKFSVEIENEFSAVLDTPVLVEAPHHITKNEAIKPIRFVDSLALEFDLLEKAFNKPPIEKLAVLNNSVLVLKKYSNDLEGYETRIKAFEVALSGNVSDESLENLRLHFQALILCMLGKSKESYRFLIRVLENKHKVSDQMSYEAIWLAFKMMLELEGRRRSVQRWSEYVDTYSFTDEQYRAKLYLNFGWVTKEVTIDLKSKERWVAVSFLMSLLKKAEMCNHTNEELKKNILNFRHEMKLAPADTPKGEEAVFVAREKLIADPIPEEEANANYLSFSRKLRVDPSLPEEKMQIVKSYK